MEYNVNELNICKILFKESLDSSDNDFIKNKKDIIERNLLSLFFKNNNYKIHKISEKDINDFISVTMDAIYRIKDNQERTKLFNTFIAMISSMIK